ncbi:MAG: hypothetical protein ACI38Q_01550 [Candidatus Bruticola sp.]
MTNSFDFFAGLLSFCILLYGLKFVLYDTLVQVAKDRAASAKERISEAEDILSQAKKQSAEWSDKLKNLPAELEEIETKAKLDAERIINESKEHSEKEAAAVLTSARNEASSIRSKVQDELQIRMADKVTERAESIIRASLDDSVSQNIIENFLTKMRAEHA